jgi:hypothetical protein
VPAPVASTAPSLTSSDAQESSSSSSVSVVAYSDEEFDSMPRLGAAECVACAFGAWGAVAPFVWPFVGGCGSRGERGRREGPAALGALSTLCWGGGRTLVRSFRITCTTWRPEFSRVKAGRNGGFLERRPRPVGCEDPEAALARVWLEVTLLG